ncbi:MULTISPECIES: hypothetical protein [Actinomycetes]|uniref:Uncharacterized protein n=1 Tax=Luedemannella helvata TaxID=349315 RepID=A0ABN2L8Q7_9ACTN|nr:hypothetical protein [Streptomyces virginiae]
MHSNDDHVHEVWIMTCGTDELTIELWTDLESIHVHGGDGEAYSGSRTEIVDSLVAKYEQAGWTLTANHEVA